MVVRVKDDGRMAASQRRLRLPRRDALTRREMFVLFWVSAWIYAHWNRFAELDRPYCTTMVSLSQGVVVVVAVQTRLQGARLAPCVFETGPRVEQKSVDPDGTATTTGL